MRKALIDSQPQAPATGTARPLSQRGLLLIAGFSSVVVLSIFAHVLNRISDPRCEPGEWFSYACAKAQPTTTNAQPTTTKAQPTTTKAQPTTTNAQPTTTNAQPTTTKAQPTTSANATDVPADSESHLARKGQFGDSFGGFTSLISAITLIVVFTSMWFQSRSLRMAQNTYSSAQSFQEKTVAAAERSLEASENSSKAQIELVKLERYYSEISSTTAAYNRALEKFVLPESKEQLNVRWHGTQGLFHAWRSIVAAMADATQQSKPYRASDVTMTTNMTKSSEVWWFVAELYGIKSHTPEASSVASEVWVRNIIRSMDEGMVENLISKLRASWRTFMIGNVYQVDALFRTWYRVYTTISNTQEFDIDGETQWRAAAQFRAQLSWIELSFLLMNQIFRFDDEADDYGKARALSERYAVFDNYRPGLDPAANLLLLLANGTIEADQVSKLRSVAFSTEKLRRGAAGKTLQPNRG
jgi:hypothetical protein